MRHIIITDLEQLFAENVLEDVLGLGGRKAEAEPPLRNELLEADPCTPVVPKVEVSSSKPTQCFVYNKTEKENTVKENSFAI